MALDERYFVTSDLDTYYVDKDSGLPLAGGTIEFWRDSARSIPKLVYQLSGAPPHYTYTALPNPIDLSSVGTVQNDLGDNIVIYYFPYDERGNLDLYYTVVRDSNGVEQLSREAWPNITSADDPTSADFPIQNQISNSQFTQVFINENQSTVYTIDDTFNQRFIFAPNWTFVVSGTGTVTVERIAIAGNDKVATSPPYVLDVTVSGGITECKLMQRFNVNSGLWASTEDEPIFLSGTLIARNEGAGTSGIQMFYIDSNVSDPILIIDASFDNSKYQFLTGVTQSVVPLSTNSDSGNEGFVEIYLSFLPSSHIRISSIQVVPTSNEAGGNFLRYELNSSNRAQALMGDYYIPRLNSRPSASILTAWNFTLNPFQFGLSGSIETTAAYICDQTIALRGESGDVTFSKDDGTLGLQLTTSGNNDAFYLMQYLSGANAKKILDTPLSVNVFAYSPSESDNVTMRIYLFRAGASASIPILPTSIGTVDTSGIFTLTASGWTEIERSGLDTAKAALPIIYNSSDIQSPEGDRGFTGWKVTDSSEISDTDKFAIVVTFAYIDASTQITVNSISLTPSDIPARPAPQSSDEVLRKCQYYYEKSCNLSQQPEDGVLNGAKFAHMRIFSNGFLNTSVHPQFISVIYNTRKRTTVVPTMYSVDGTPGNVFALLYNGPTTVLTGNVIIANWTVPDQGESGVNFEPLDRADQILSYGVANLQNPESIVLFQYVADARLGIV